MTAALDYMTRGNEAKVIVQWSRKLNSSYDSLFCSLMHSVFKIHGLYRQSVSRKKIGKLS